MKPFLYFILTICILNAQGQVSLFDTIELQKLKKEISNSSIVGLGEVEHGFESINEAKSTLLNMLQTELNFNAVAFESSFIESIVSFLNNDALETRAKNFLYPFWNTTSVKTALKNLFDNEKSLLKPLIIGFDIQEDCRFQKFSEYLISKRLITTNKDKLKDCDSILSSYIGKDFSRKGAITNQEYLLLIHNYKEIAEEIKTKKFDALQKKLIERSIENRKWLCKYLTLTNVREKMYHRDSIMADNISWLKNELYSVNKLIIWAANTHIAKFTSNKKPTWTGEWLSSVYGDKYFTIAFQKGSGDKTFYLKNIYFNYSNNANEKFNMVIYLDKLRKIKAQEWITHCD